MTNAEIVRRLENSFVENSASFETLKQAMDKFPVHFRSFSLEPEEWEDCLIKNPQARDQAIKRLEPLRGIEPPPDLDQPK